MERLPHVRGDPIKGGASFDGNTHVGYVTNFRSAVWFCEYCLAEIASDLLPVDFKSGNECNVFHFVVPKHGMHQTRGEVVFFRRVLPVVLYPLYQCTSTIPNACKCCFDLCHLRGSLGFGDRSKAPHYKPRNAKAPTLYSESSYSVRTTCCSTSDGLAFFAFSHSSALISPPACSLILFASDGPMVRILINCSRLLSLISSIDFNPASYNMRALTRPTPSSVVNLTSSGRTPFASLTLSISRGASRSLCPNKRPSS